MTVSSPRPTKLDNRWYVVAKIEVPANTKKSDIEGMVSYTKETAWENMCKLLEKEFGCKIIHIPKYEENSEYVEELQIITEIRADLIIQYNE